MIELKPKGETYEHQKEKIICLVDPSISMDWAMIRQMSIFDFIYVDLRDEPRKGESYPDSVYAQGPQTLF